MYLYYMYAYLIPLRNIFYGEGGATILFEFVKQLYVARFKYARLKLGFFIPIERWQLCEELIL